MKNPSPGRGVRLLGSGGTSQPFQTIVLRNHFIRRSDDSTNDADIGVQIDSWDRAIVENNILNIGSNLANGVRHPDTSPFFKPFDNMKSDGTLLRAYNTTTGLFESELADDVQDVYLAL